MAALTQATDRRCEGGVTRFLPLTANALPFQGSLIGLAPTTGYARVLVAGDQFAGIATKTILAKDSPTSSGGLELQVMGGTFRFVAVISGVTRADIVSKRAVYASTDNDFSLTAAPGNSYVGRLVELESQFGGSGTNAVVVQAETYDVVSYNNGGGLQIETAIADTAQLLTVNQLDKLLVAAAVTAGRAWTLPAAALCTGRTFKIKHTTGTFAITVTGNAAELIDGANTKAIGTGDYTFLEIISDGTKWHTIGAI